MKRICNAILTAVLFLPICTQVVYAQYSIIPKQRISKNPKEEVVNLGEMTVSATYKPNPVNFNYDVIADVIITPLPMTELFLPTPSLITTPQANFSDWQTTFQQAPNQLQATYTSIAIPPAFYVPSIPLSTKPKTSGFGSKLFNIEEMGFSSMSIDNKLAIVNNASETNIGANSAIDIPGIVSDLKVNSTAFSDIGISVLPKSNANELATDISWKLPSGGKFGVLTTTAFDQRTQYVVKYESNPLASINSRLEYNTSEGTFSLNNTLKVQNPLGTPDRYTLVINSENVNNTSYGIGASLSFKDGVTGARYEVFNTANGNYGLNSSFIAPGIPNVTATTTLSRNEIAGNVKFNWGEASATLEGSSNKDNGQGIYVGTQIKIPFNW